MATKRRKVRKSRRRSCKHGKLKRPVRTRKGGNRRCKKSRKSRKSKKMKRSRRKKKYKMQREDSLGGFTEEDDDVEFMFGVNAPEIVANVNAPGGTFQPNNFTTQETRQLQQNFAQQQAQRQRYTTGLNVAQNEYNENTTPEEQQAQAQAYTKNLQSEADDYNQSMGIRNQLNKIQRQIESNQANQAAIGYPATQQNQLATLQNQQNQLATLPAGFQAAYVNNELDIQAIRSRAEHQAISQTYLRYVMLTEAGDPNPPHPSSVPFGQWPPSSQSSNFIFEGQNQPGFIPSQQLVDDDILKQMWQVAGYTVFPGDIPDQKAIGQDMRLMIERGRALEEERRNQLSRVDTETLHYLLSREEFANIMSQPTEQQEQFLQQRLGSIASDFQQLLQQSINENDALEALNYTQQAVNSRDYVDRVEKVVEGITGNKSSLSGRPTFSIWTQQPQLEYQTRGMLQ